MPNIHKPDSTEYASFYAGYVAKADTDDVLKFLQDQLAELQELLADVEDSESERLQQPYHWSIKQLIGHLIDGEKIFGYRLHRMACGDPTPMAGFDHEPYVDNLDYQNVTLRDLVAEFAALRQANLLFCRRLPDEAVDRVGTASDCQFTVRSQTYILAGHVQHHLEILHDRVRQLKSA